MNVHQINRALREGHTLFARGQFRAYRVYGARSRKGRRELNVVLGVIDGKAHSAWIGVRGFGMVVEAKDGPIL